MLKRYVLACVTGIGLLVGCSSCASRGGSFDQVQFERDIRQSLPVGSSYEQIDAYLSSHNISHSYVERERRFYGLIPDVEQRGLTSKSIQILITLDDKKQLQNLEVKALYTGP